MKNAVILHGTSETAESFWFPYITRELEKKGYVVNFPVLPDADNPEITKWLPVAMQESYIEETVIIAHSAGCALALSVLEQVSTPVKQVVLVSGYVRPIGGDTTIHGVLQESYHWEKINHNVGDIIFLNSDNDPWGCTDVEGRYMLDHIGKGKLVVKKGEGHMGSDSFNQPYKEFPFLLRLIE